MLEQPALLLRPWSRAAGGVRSRAVLDAATGAALGVARELPSDWPVGLRWLVGPVVAVYESEDESLLCRARGALGFRPRSWRVADADGQLVGRVRNRRGPNPSVAVLDRWGRTVATGRVAAATSLVADGVELARIQQDGDGVRLTFGAFVDGNPFVRMLLLMAALTWEG